MDQISKKVFKYSGSNLDFFKAGNKKSTLRVCTSVRMTEVKISLKHVSLPMRARRHGELSIMTRDVMNQ